MAKKDQESELVIPVNKDKTYGITVEANRLNVTVYARKLYTEDTKIPMKFNRQAEYKFYSAGEYGPWQLAPRPYKTNIKSALDWVLELMVMDGLEQEADICKISELLSKSQDQMSQISSSIVADLSEKLSGSQVPAASLKLDGQVKNEQLSTPPET